MIIERLNDCHIDSLCDIENQCFSHPWSRASFEAELIKDCSVFFVAVKQGNAVGCIAANVSIDEGYISKVMVSESFRNAGIASALMKELIDFAEKKQLKRLSLEVRESNIYARKLYEKFGFNYLGIIKNMYDDPQENAAVYEKEL